MSHSGGCSFSVPIYIRTSLHICVIEYFYALISFITARTSETANRKTAITTKSTPTATRNFDFAFQTGVSNMALIRHKPENERQIT